MRFLTKLSLFMEKDYPLPKLLVTCIEYQVWLNTNTTPKPQYFWHGEPQYQYQNLPKCKPQYQFQYWSKPQYQYQVLSVSAGNVTGETWVSPVSVGQVREPPTRFFHTQNLGSVGQYTRVDCMPWIDPMVIDYVSKVIRIDTSRPRRVVCATSKQKDSLNDFASIHRAHQKLFIIFPWSQILNVKKSSHLFSHNFQGYKSPNDKGFFQAPFNILLNRLQIITWLCKSFPTSISKTRTG